jgi:hypothetical protein
MQMQCNAVTVHNSTEAANSEFLHNSNTSGALPILYTIKQKRRTSEPLHN